MSDWKAEWTGGYPNLCSGEWVLYKDGKELETDIPFQDGPADTEGTYSTWYFDGDWDEQWEYYDDGLNEQEWIERYRSWLETIANEIEFPAIFKAFQADDFRYSSCGGCI